MYTFVLQNIDIFYILHLPGKNCKPILGLSVTMQDRPITHIVLKGIWSTVFDCYRFTAANARTNVSTVTKRSRLPVFSGHTFDSIPARNRSKYV